MKLKSIAVFMICLVVMLPIYISTVIAQGYIIDVKVSGIDNVDGYRKAFDVTKAYATVKIDGDDEVTPDQVKYGISHFGQCTPDVNNFSVCTYVSTEDYLSAGSQSFEIKLFDDDGAEVKSTSGSYIVDIQGPDINSFSISDSYIGDENFTLSYEIQDVGCSGLKSISIYKDGNVSLYETIEKETSSCYTSGDLEVDGSNFASSQGPIQICIQARDMLFQDGPFKCIGAVVDLDPPVLMNAWVEVSGEKLEYIGTGTRAVTIVLNLSDIGSGLDVGSVTANFEKLFSGYFGFTVANSCSMQDDNYECRWEGVSFNADGERNIDVFAMDMAGNSVNQSISLDITLDNVKPEAQLLYTPFTDGENYYVGQTTNFTLVVTESGSGFTQNMDVYLDFSDINGQNSVQADNCTTTTCYWEDIPGSLNENYWVYIKLLDVSKDDAGNTFVEGKSFKFIADYTDPLIESVNMTTSSGFCPTYQDTITVNMSVSETAARPPTVRVNVSWISTDGYLDIECTEIDDPLNPVPDENNCLLTISNLVDYEVFDNLILEVRDKAGNKADPYVLPVQICKLSDAPAEDIDEVDTTVLETLPRYLDLSLVSSIPTLMFFKLDMDKKSSSIQILQKAATCSVKDQPISASSIFFLNEDSDMPYLGVYLSGAAAADTTSIDLICNISMKIQEGNTIYQNNEIDEVTINIQTKNQALGQISSSVQDKIDEIDAEITKLDEDIEQMDTYNGYLSMLCSIAEGMTIISGVLAVLVTVLYALAKWPPLKSLSGVCIMLGNFWGFIKTWIWPPGTGLYNAPPVALVKWGCMIYSCWLCTGYDLLGSTDSNSKQGGIWGLGSDSGEPTTIGPISISGYDPYKSIHVSRSCLCLPGIVYNMNKDKQIKCIYKNCIKNHATNGLPTTNCDIAYKENQCLYVDGAAWKIAGQKGLVGFLSSFLSAILESIPLILAGWGWELICSEATNAPSFAANIDLVCEDTSSEPFLYLGCMVSGGALQIVEANGFNSNIYDWDKYNADLEGHDFCGS